MRFTARCSGMCDFCGTISVEERADNPC